MLCSLFILDVGQHQVREGQKLVPLKVELVVFTLMNDGAPLIPSLQVECASIDRNTPITNRHSDRLASFTLLRILVDLAAE